MNKIPGLHQWQERLRPDGAKEGRMVSSCGRFASPWSRPLPAESDNGRRRAMRTLRQLILNPQPTTKSNPHD